MGVSKNRDFYPPNHPLKNRVFHYKPSILGGFPPIFGNTHIGNGKIYEGGIPELTLWAWKKQINVCSRVYLGDVDRQVETPM